MENEHNDRKMESIYSKRLRAGKRRTYFFDVRATKGNDYYLTITESRKRFDDNGYDRHKVFLYKEDFNKFLKAISEAIDFVKTDLMPDFDFDAFSHEDEDGEPDSYTGLRQSAVSTPAAPTPSNAPEAEQENNQPQENLTDQSTAQTEASNDHNSHQHEEVDKW